MELFIGLLILLIFFISSLSLRDREKHYEERRDLVREVFELKKDVKHHKKAKDDWKELAIMKINESRSLHFKNQEIKMIAQQALEGEYEKGGELHNVPEFLHGGFVESITVGSVDDLDDPFLSRRIDKFLRNLQGQPVSFDCHNEGISHRGETIPRCNKFCGNHSLCPKSNIESKSRKS